MFVFISFLLSFFPFSFFRSVCFLFALFSLFRVVYTMDMSLVVRIALQVIRDGVPQLVSIYRSLAYYWYCGTRIILLLSIVTFL